MRSAKHARMGKNWMRNIRRLAGEGVHTDAGESLCLQSLVHDVQALKQTSAGQVDDDRGRLDQPQSPAIHHALGGVRQRSVQTNKIRPRKQGIELYQSCPGQCCLVLRDVRVVSNHLHLEGVGHLRQLFSDTT